MNNYMECFDEILSAAEADFSEEEMRAVLNKEEIKECFRNETFCGDFIALCIARDHAAGINAARDAAGLDTGKKYPESISFFVPLLSGKRRRTAQLSCIELAENFCGLNAPNFRENNTLGYNSMLYMFIVGDCIEAIEKFLDVYMLMGTADDSLSDFIRIAAKRKKTEIIKLFAKRGFTVSEEDIEYLYDRDGEYADIIVESELITVHSDEDEFAEEDDEEAYSGDIQMIKNWTIKTDIDRIEVSGNVYDSQRELPDGRFCSFDAAYCAELNDDAFIVCEKGAHNNNAYILRFDEELKDAPSEHTARLEDIFEFCKNNTADHEKIADLLLSDGDSLVIQGINFSSRTIQKGEQPEGKPCYIYHCNNKEKTITRSVLNEKNKTDGLPVFRMSGRDFYMCFDLLAEVLDGIIKDKPSCGYAEKIRKMLDAETGITEKHHIRNMIFTCLRYYASEGNYSDTLEILKEYVLDNGAMQNYDSTDFVFGLLNAESAEVKKIAYKRITFRPDLNVFSIIPFLVGNLICAVDESFETRCFRSEDVSKIICWLAEKRDRNAVFKFSRMCCRIKDTDLLELALRSPDTVYDFIQNNFYDTVSDNLKKDGVIKSIDEMIRTLAFLDITDTGYFTFISYAYIFFDKKDLEFILSRMPKIKYVSSRDLNDIYRNEANYCCRAYDGKPKIACYFDRLFSETVRVEGSDFTSRPMIKNELRSKLTNHRFTVTVYNLNDIVLGLPKNFDFELSRRINTEEFLRGLVKSEDRHRIIAAIRHNILNGKNVYRTIEYAVENHCYISLKTIYRIFNLKNRK